MPDLQQRFVHQRTARAHQLRELEIALARHGADLEHAVRFTDICKALDAVQIDYVIRQHEAHVEHRHQRLSTGKQLGVIAAAQQFDDLSNCLRIVISERRRFHCVPGED